MPVDAAVAMLLARLRGLPRLEELSPIDAREAAASLSRGEPPGPTIERVESHIVDSADGALALRLYRPVAKARAILLYFHGGGWTIGTLDSVDAALRSFALRTGLCPTSVDYRLAPETPFPRRSTMQKWRWPGSRTGRVNLPCRVPNCGSAATARAATSPQRRRS